MSRLTAKLRRWFHEHSLKLLAIRDTPEAIAGGVAIGIFFGFMPVFGLKTVGSVFFAWLTGCNILAAVIAGALHDLIIPLMPAIYMWEYDVGYWLLSSPHQWPSLQAFHLERPAWHMWRTFFSIGKPLLLGGVVCSTPAAVVTFFILKRIVARHQRKKRLLEKLQADEQANPS